MKRISVIKRVEVIFLTFLTLILGFSFSTLTSKAKASGNAINNVYYQVNKSYGTETITRGKYVFWLSLNKDEISENIGELIFKVSSPNKDKVLFENTPTSFTINPYTNTVVYLDLNDENKVDQIGTYTVEIIKGDEVIETGTVELIKVNFNAGDGKFADESTVYSEYGMYDDYLFNFNYPSPISDSENSFIGWASEKGVTSFEGDNRKYSVEKTLKLKNKRQK